MQYPWHLYLMAIIYIITGILHFAKPKMYVSIMPLYIPYKKTMVYISGLTEILLGIVLFTSYKRFALWGIIVMLLAFIPVHIYMLQDKKFKNIAPRWMLLLRIPLQFILIYWAYWYLLLK